MKPRKRILDELEEILFSAYRTQRETAPNARWREAVMGEVRLLGVLEPAKDNQVLFVRFERRFLAAACFVALMLLVYIASNGFVDYQELAMRFLENPIDFII